MKKSAVFLILSFVPLGFFACQFAIPTAVEIIGNPSAKFSETVDVGKMFEDLIRHGIDKDERLIMIPCTQPEIITNLIYLELINEEYDDLTDKEKIEELFPGTNLIPDDINDDPFLDDIPLTTDKNLILLDSMEDKENRLIVPLSELGLLLPGFVFYNGKDGGYEARLYFSGSEIIEKSIIDITIVEVKKGDDGEYTPLPGTEHTICDGLDITDDKSDIEKWIEDECYDGETCPSSGEEIIIPLTGNDIAISFKVYIPENTILHLSDFKASYIKVELVLWLPLKFVAVAEKAALFFPDDYFFSSEKDLFGREKPDSESLVFDIVESLSVDINFQKHPFKGGELIILNKGEITFEEGNLNILDKGVDIRSPIEKDDALSFTVAEDNMKEINKPDNWPFAPNIIIGFKEKDTLSFTKDFKAFEFAFKAKVRYRKDL